MRPGAPSTSAPSTASSAEAAAGGRARSWCANSPPWRADAVQRAHLLLGSRRLDGSARLRARGPLRPHPLGDGWVILSHADRLESTTSWVRCICSPRGSPRCGVPTALERRFRAGRRLRSARQPGTVRPWCACLVGLCPHSRRSRVVPSQPAEPTGAVKVSLSGPSAASREAVALRAAGRRSYAVPQVGESWRDPEGVFVAAASRRRASASAFGAPEQRLRATQGVHVQDELACATGLGRWYVLRSSELRASS
jgi:hypothetical protein